jgi:DNA-binding beta-propeller fold protein YncE
MRRTLTPALAFLLVPFAAAGRAADRPADAFPDYRPVLGWPQLPPRLTLGPVSAVATDAEDRVFVAHRGPKPILVFDSGGKFLRSWGDEHIKTAHGLRVDPAGNVWVIDIGNHLVMKFDPEGKLLLSLGQKGRAGDGPEQFDRPTDVAVAPTGEFFVTDGYGNSRVLKFDRDGKLIKQWGKKGKGEGEFNLPHAVCLDAKGRVLVGDRENDRVQLFDANGKFLEQWKQSGAPFGLSPAGDKLFVADGRANWVRVLGSDGKPLGRFGEKGAAAGQFQMPHMLCVDSRGDVYVAEVNNKRVQKFTAARAEGPAARVVKFHGYSEAIELKLGKARAVLCPQAGGRVLAFSVEGADAMWLDPAEKEWQPGRAVPITAGRFDYGPELTVAEHPKAWGGAWSEEITKAGGAKLTSPRDDPGGIQLVREFRLVRYDDSVGLSCKQTMTNGGKETREVCHWGRSFSPGGGICVIPLGDRPSRFPSKYAMYEDSAVINVKAKDDNIRERDGFLEVLAPPRKPKLGFDSYAGWLAYVMPNNTAFVKRFPAFPDRVYNEAAGLTLSVWYPTGSRIELEPIGPRERLKPGESASFTEDWWLLPHPFPRKGEKIDLKALAEQVAKQTAAGK